MFIACYCLVGKVLSSAIYFNYSTISKVLKLEEGYNIKSRMLRYPHTTKRQFIFGAKHKGRMLSKGGANSWS